MINIIKPPQLVSIFDIFVESPYKSWRNPLHMHNNTEIFFVQEGEGEFIVDNVLFRPKKGDVIVHHPMVEHQEASSGSSTFRAISIQFNGLILSDKPEGLILDDGHSPLIPLQDSYSLVNRYLQDILAEYQSMKPFSNEMISSLIQTVVLVMLRAKQSEQVQSYSEITRTVINYIDSHFRNELSLNDLADIVHISPYHLAHVFKKEVGVSPIQYLIRCRIEEAKKQLIETKRTIADIAEDVGYPNANYFNVLFKKMTGENPGKFRAKRK